MIKCEKKEDNEDKEVKEGDHDRCKRSDGIFSRSMALPW
jgi:hypothetical protein